MHQHTSFVKNMYTLIYLYFRADGISVLLSTPPSSLQSKPQSMGGQSKGETLNNINTVPSFEDSADFATAIIFVDGVWSWQTWCKKFMDFPIKRTWTKQDLKKKQLAYKKKK